MKRLKNYFFQCENMLEEYEEEISEWYYNLQDNNLYKWLCRNRVLKQKNKGIGCSFVTATHEVSVNVCGLFFH